MGSIPDFSFPSTTNLLQVLQEEGMKLPLNLQRQINALKSKLRKALQQDHEALEGVLESLLPTVWELRIQALPILAKTDLKEALEKVQQEVNMLPQRYPSLSDVVERLAFGIQLMSQFTQQLIHQHPDVFNQASVALLPDSPHVSYEKIIAQLKETGDEEANIMTSFLHGSLLMEPLLISVDMAAEEQIQLDAAMCYELKYQSALAVEDYAKIIGLDYSQMPWYKAPQTDLQRLLLNGPTLNEADLQYILEKQSHLNTWR